MTVPRAKHPTRQRIAAELQKGTPLSKYDIEARCFIAMRNANAYLKIMHEAGEIHIAGYRRDSPHGCPTKMWAYGQGVDAKKPKAKTMAQKSREYRIKNPEVVINEIMRKRAQRYKEKVNEVASTIPQPGKAHCHMVERHNQGWCSGSRPQQTNP